MIAFLFERAKLQTVSQAVEGITCYRQAHSPLKKTKCDKVKYASHHYWFLIILKHLFCVCYFSFYSEPNWMLFWLHLWDFSNVSYNGLQVVNWQHISCAALDFVVKSLATHCNVINVVYAISCTLFYYQSFWQQYKCVHINIRVIVHV